MIADCIEQGITSFKLYMAYPETLQVDDDVIVDVLRATGRHGGLVTMHAENGAAITRARAPGVGGRAPPAPSSTP